LLLLALTVSGMGAEKLKYGDFHRADRHWCFGMGPKIGVSDWGAHLRILNRDIWGFDFSGFRNWDQEGYGGTAELLFKFPKDAPVRPYLAIGAGVYRANIDTSFEKRNFTTDLTLMHYVGKIGAEARFGEHDKHGIAIETGYQYGKGYYDFRYTPIGDNNQSVKEMPFKVKPVELNLMYTFYLCKEKIGDTDLDGLIDTVDKCITMPEDKDGFEDSDGCPDIDNDNDGILDTVDQCPNNPEDRDSFEDEDGCPDLDNDKDGILDDVDQCPNAPEDMDGFEDADGCPELDNDKDGLVDTVDQCPNDPETVNKFKDEDGCPDEEPKAMEITREAIVLDGVTFHTAKATLKPESFPVLDKVVLSLLTWEEVQIEIQGHTDNVGKADYNLKLSHARAQSVKAYLVSKGIKESRMRAVGYGMERPIADNATEEGRSINRRVTMQKTN